MTAPRANAPRWRTRSPRAVEALGGEERTGQIEMAEAVAEAMVGGEHLLVQAGTGTGKSLAYLVPALLHDSRVVVATATLALQHQLVERDIPRLVEAVGDLPGVDASYAVLKGRSNYACLHRIRAGVPDDQGALIEVPQGSMATKVLELRAWAEEEAEGKGTGERDNAPRHTDREWRQVSVNHRECLGASKCPFGAECFAELAREKAQRSHLIVTNHSLLAIDAIEGVPMIPDYDVVVVDEAHELTSRITQAATDELFAADVDRAAKRSQRHVEGNQADDLADAGDALRAAMSELAAGPDRPAARRARRRAGRGPQHRAGLPVGLPQGRGRRAAGDGDAGLTQAKGSVQEVFVTAERMAAGSEADVLWLSEGSDRHAAPALRRAAPGVGADARASCSPTSSPSSPAPPCGSAATSARSRRASASSRRRTSTTRTAASSASEGVLPWRGLDVGSPFDYGQQAILYVARHLPPPGRDGLGPAQLDEIVELVDAGEGRALGLFSSRRAAETAAEAVRERLPHLTTLAQGDAQLPELARQFLEDPHTCPVRHPLAVAGARRPGRHLPAGADRPDPVPAPRRPADERPAAGRRPGRRQRLHAGRRHPRRAAARPGLRPADPHDDRPRRGRRPRPAAGHRPLRRLPQGQPPADVDHHRPGGRPQGAGPAGRGAESAR